MRDSGRLAGAIEVLTSFEAQHVPLKTCLTDWGRAHRFAGSGDRSWISSLCHDVVRRRRSLAARMQDDSPRAACLAALNETWNWPPERIAQTVEEEPYGPGALTDSETAHLVASSTEIAAADITGDIPAWLAGSLGWSDEELMREGRAMADRAPIDLRINTLKADNQKAMNSLSKLSVQPAEYVETALRIEPPKGHEKSPALEAMPAFAKGWIEVQDLGSQLVSLAAGNVTGKQVLDYCAGAGGKTLALAALSGNSGQIFAWDVDARRLAPIFDRLRRAGTRNVQVRSPAEGADLNDLKSAMDIVFVDAPCSGSGTWRRKPDAKWRLKEQQLQKRLAQQDEVLREAATFVKPGGHLVYVTCSIIPAENQNRVHTFLTQHPDFEQTDPLNHMQQTGLLKEGASSVLRGQQYSDSSLQLTPYRTGTDGFYVATLVKKG